jgi:hypothetical protein
VFIWAAPPRTRLDRYQRPPLRALIHALDNGRLAGVDISSVR